MFSPRACVGNQYSVIDVCVVNRKNPNNEKLSHVGILGDLFVDKPKARVKNHTSQVNFLYTN